MYVTHVEKVKDYTVDKEGTHNVTVKYLLHKGVGAKNLQLRLFKIDVKGYTPLEKHATNMRSSSCEALLYSVEENKKLLSDPET